MKLFAYLGSICNDEMLNSVIEAGQESIALEVEQFHVGREPPIRPEEKKSLKWGKHTRDSFLVNSSGRF
jgi:hypothetical protein